MIHKILSLADTQALRVNSLERIEMHLDKLQTIATTPVAATHKIMWLKWWNSGQAIRDTYFFPRPLCPESQLLPWLNRASFYAGVSSFTTYFPDIYVDIGVAKVQVWTQFVPLVEFCS